MRNNIVKCRRFFLALLSVLIIPISIFSFNVKNAEAVGYTFIQGQYEYRVSGSGHVFTSPNTASNTIVVAAVWNSTGTPVVSDTRGNTYTLAKMQTNTSPGGAGVWVAHNIAGGTNTVKLTLAGQAFDATYLEYSGLVSTDQVAGVGSSFSGTPSSGNTPMTTQANEMVFGFLANNNNSPTAGSGFTGRVTGAAGFNINTEDKRVTATGQYAANFSNSTGSWIAIAVTFREAPPPDTTAPTVPTGLSATAISSSQINLIWTASTDAVGVTGYNVYRNGVLITTVSGTSYANTGLTASTQYTYTVSAFDVATNTSTQSASVQASTLPLPDTTAPTVPTGLSATATSSSQINLTWNPSFDAVGVTGYNVYRNGVLITTVSGTSYANTGLTASTQYTYTVSAFDLATNTSTQSASVQATTQAGLPPPPVGGTPYTFIQGQYQFKSSGSGYTFTSPNAAGNTIIVGAVWASTGTPTISDTRGNVYTLVKMHSNASPRTVGVWVAHNIQGGANTVTLTLAGVSFGATYFEYSGLSSTDQVASVNGNGGTPSSGNTPTTTQSNEMIFGFVTNSAASPNAGSLFTSRANGTGVGYVRAEDRRVTAIGQYPANFGTVAGNWIVVAVTLKERPSSDTTAPTVPTGLSATATSSSQINLTWNPSFDAVGVTGYNVYRNGVLITTVSGTSYANTGLTASTQYTYTVSAFDLATNTSTQSASVQATTQAGLPPPPPVGSAELPRVFIDTTYALPTGGTLWTPMTSANFQTALNSAALGDVIQLQAGTTYTGPFTLPNKTTGSGWIYIQSSAYAQLPIPNNRVFPSQANLMPKIVGGSPVRALDTATSAHHFRFVGIEFKPTPGQFGTSFIRLGNGETSEAQLPHDIVFDRCYIHGDPTVGGRRGIALNSATSAVIDSYLSDWKEVGADSQALSAWNSPGPFKIVNNYLEGATENIIIGGSDPSIANLIPSDIEIRGNYFYKPPAWRSQGFAVKNLFETKNARRLLLEGNIFENMWEGDQDNSINIGNSNQNGTSPWVTTVDVTFRYNIVRHGPSGIRVCGRNCGNIYPSVQGGRYVFQDNLFYDINSATWGGSGFFLLSVNTAPDLVLNHNTIIHDGNTYAGGDDGGQSAGFQFSNNIVQRGPNGFDGTGFQEGTPTLNALFPGHVFTKNVIAGASAGSYPAGNFFPAAYSNVGFTNMSAGDYRLAASSPYRNAGTDGKDLGADITLLNTKTSCVISGLCSVLLPPLGVPTPPSNCSITSSLRLGSKGSEVVCLQISLGGLTIDGNFGPKTRAAVINFQSNSGLVGDGVFGSKSHSVWNNK